MAGHSCFNSTSISCAHFVLSNLTGTILVQTFIISYPGYFTNLLFAPFTPFPY